MLSILVVEGVRVILSLKAHVKSGPILWVIQWWWSPRSQHHLHRRLISQWVVVLLYKFCDPEKLQIRFNKLQKPNSCHIKSGFITPPSKPSCFHHKETNTFYS